MTIYEYCNDLFDLNYLKSALINEKTIIVDINFKDIKYFQKKSDFSFDVLFNIENLKNNITIHFDNLNELDMFKEHLMLIYEEPSKFIENFKKINNYYNGMRTNNFVQGSNFIAHKKSSSVDRFSYNNKNFNFKLYR